MTEKRQENPVKGEKELELYVHIPFCARKCAYCDFLSAPADEETRSAYVRALEAEIRGKKEEYKEYRVSTVFVGGGTPSILDGDDTARIFAALYESFRISDDAEITMEVNPGTVTEEKLAAWKQAGVNRLSIGLQSADDRELRLLGRIHTYKEFLETYEQARRAGFQNINIDLISAIPGQTLQSWETTLAKTADLEPEHISAYSLIVEEGTPFYDRYGRQENGENDGSQNGLQNGEPEEIRSGEMKEARNKVQTEAWPPLPDEDEERRIYKRTKSFLEERGYHQYEISNYARPGYECRHNLGYWDRKEYLGFGLGASSLVNNRRFHNTADMDKYMKAFRTERSAADIGSDIYEDVEELSLQDCMEEFMFLGLRKTDGISRTDFAHAFHRDISEIYGSQLKKLEKEGLIDLKDDRILLTERGTDVSNMVFVEFMF